jgi:vitamin B12 transporter
MNKLFLLLLASSVISAAHAETTVPQIVVTATRSPADLTRIASSVTVITQEDIEKKNKPSVIELLRLVPGISIPNSGGTGQNTRVFMRGTNSNHVLVMMDGVALNDPSDTANAYDFSNLVTDNIERIEILRGPQSTLYGSQAIGGVINIISKKGVGKPSYSGYAEYGRYNSFREGISAMGEEGQTSYSVSAAHRYTDGISSFDKRLGGREKDVLRPNSPVATAARSRISTRRAACPISARGLTTIFIPMLITARSICAQRVSCYPPMANGRRSLVFPR